MKKQIIFGLAVLGLAGAVQAANATNFPANADVSQVDSIQTFHRIDGWRPVDRDTLIIWVTPSRPYVLELSRPSYDMPFEPAIGVTSFAGTVHAKFDDVIVDGMRYPIKAIYKIDRNTAKHLRGTA